MQPSCHSRDVRFAVGVTAGRTGGASRNDEMMRCGWRRAIMHYTLINGVGRDTALASFTTR